MLENQWKGKLWYAYGTSMTSVEQGKFVPVVEKLSGLTVVNKGIPGGCLTPDGYGKGNVKTAVLDPDDGKKDADLITLEVLPNEGAKVGDIYDTDDESFCGCFNQCLRFLLRRRANRPFARSPLISGFRSSYSPASSAIIFAIFRIII